MPRLCKLPKRYLRSRRRLEWVAEITPTPSAPEEPIKSSNSAIAVNEWLKLVASYWQKAERQKN